MNPSTARELMVDRHIRARGVRDPRVLEALSSVPREMFVPPHLTEVAYADRPLAIEAGQTISQPYIVAVMTEALDLEPTDRVLEIGTGSGYAAAVLARIAKQVYTIERHAELADIARDRLAELGYLNAAVRCADGTLGWREHAPFDAIVVTAAPDHVPEALVEQLAPGGRLVIPVGARGGVQNLLLLEKTATGVVRRNLMPVMFVPLRRDPEQ